MKIEKVETLKFELTLAEARKLNWLIDFAIGQCDDSARAAPKFGADLIEKMKEFIN